MAETSPITETVQSLEKMLNLMLDLATTIVRVNNKLADPDKHLHNNITRIVYPMMQRIFKDQVLFAHVYDKLEKTEGVSRPVAPASLEVEEYNKELERLLDVILRAKEDGGF